MGVAVVDLAVQAQSGSRNYFLFYIEFFAAYPSRLILRPRLIPFPGMKQNALQKSPRGKRGISKCP
jgi:hypothetical protein